MEEKQLRILIETILDERGAKAAADSLNKVKETAKGVGQETQRTTGGLDSMGKSATSVLGTISKMAVMLTAATAPMVISARQYVASVNMAEGTSRQWLKTQYDLEQTQIRIGRINAEKTLPFMQAYSGLMEKVAGFAEKNPTLFAAGEAGAGLLGSGVVINAISKMLIRGGGGAAGAGAAGGIAGLLGLGGAAGGINALGGVGTAVYGPAVAPAAAPAGTAAVGVGMAPIIGAIAAVALTSFGFKQALFKLIKDPEFIRNQNALDTLTPEQLAIIEKTPGPAKGAAAMAFAQKNLANGAQVSSDLTAKTPLEQFTDIIKKLLGQQEDRPSSGTPGGEFIPTQTLQKMRQFQIQERYAQEDYDRQRFVANRDFNRQLAYSEQDFYRQRGYSLRDFNINFAFTEKMFYLQRSIAQRDFNISLSRNEYDYALSRRRAQEDHNFSLKQIMLSGDALQYYYSQRQFNIDKRRAEEDYQRQRQRSIEDFNRQQSDSAYQFNLQRAQSLLQFTIQLNDSQKEFEIQRERQKVQFGIQLDDVDFQYRRERTRRWESFTESILPEIMKEADYRALMEKNLTATMINNFNTLMSKFVSDWNGYWAGMKAPTATGTGGTATGGTGGTSNAGHHFVGQYAEGGYTRAGLAELHDKEFVLNPSTTKVAEAAARGTLTQEKIIAALTGANAGLNYVDNRQFSRGLTPEEKIVLRHETQQIVLDAFGR